MLVNINATQLKKINAVVDLHSYIENLGGRYKRNSSSRNVDETIRLARIALTAFIRSVDPKARGRLAIEDVYKETDTHTLIGAIIKDGNLKGSRDTTELNEPQLHVDATMVIFSYDIMCGPRAFENVAIQMPDKQEYKSLYFCPTIFAEYINSEHNPYHDPGKTELLTNLEESFSRTCDLVKSKDRLHRHDIELLIKFVWQYGRLLSYFEKGETPEKYVISTKWMTKAIHDLPTNPYFIFRHVWRCYFRLAKEGYVL